jgi:deoxyribodipyrimidine photo-lyase
MTKSAQIKSILEDFQQTGIHQERLLVFVEREGRWVPRTFKSSENVGERICLENALTAANDPRVPQRKQDKDFVLCLSSAFRRDSDNATLATAMWLAEKLSKPLLIIDILSACYPWASERHHAFLIDSALERARNLNGFLFVPLGKNAALDPEVTLNFNPNHQLPPEFCFSAGSAHAGEAVPNSELVVELLQRASAVVCDWSPNFIFPSFALRSMKIVRKKNPKVPFLLVDDNGVVPLFAYEKSENAARFIRPKLEKWTKSAPLEKKSIECFVSQFSNYVTNLSVKGQFCIGKALENKSNSEFDLEALLGWSGVSKSVPRVELRGGRESALIHLQEFVRKKMAKYKEERNHPDENVGSKLSPYLHYGMIHPREIISVIEGLRSFLPSEDSANTFLDELVTWRELGLNMAHFAFMNGVSLGSAELVPPWAWQTLEKHTVRLEKTYPLDELENALTSDIVWNAAQNELLETGVIHNYMRMIWGKGIIRYSKGPQEALERMEYLNNKYALDGRDANSYSGIYWCLGKFDRPWPPARPPFGMVRAMSSAAALRKLKMKDYLTRYSNKKKATSGLP